MKRGLKILLLIGVLISLVLFSNAWVTDKGNGNYEILTSTYNATLHNDTGILEFRDLYGTYMFEIDSIIHSNGTIINRSNTNVQSVTLYNGTDVTSLIVVQNATRLNFTTNYTFYRTTGLIKVNQTIGWNINTSVGIGKVILNSNLTNKTLIEDDGEANSYCFLSAMTHQMKKEITVTTVPSRENCGIQLYFKWYESEGDSFFNSSVSMYVNEHSYNLTSIIREQPEDSFSWWEETIPCSDLSEGINNITFNLSGKVGTEYFYLGADGSVDYNHSAGYNGTLWNYENLRPSGSAFDGEYMIRLVLDNFFDNWNSTFLNVSNQQFAESILNPKYSPKVARLNLSNDVSGNYSNLSVVVYGDRFSAKNVEELNEITNSVEVYFYKNTSHEWRTSVNFDNGTYMGAEQTYYEDRRSAGDHDSFSFAIEIKNEIPSIWVSKSRYPRAYDAAFTVVDDTDSSTKDTLLAVYYGTNNTSSPDYGNKGFVGHNLKITTTTWVYGTGASGGCGFITATYGNAADCASMWNLLYNEGFELALHTVGAGSDNRTETQEGIQNFTERGYPLYNWIEHYSECGNMENADCFGNIASNTTYYITDILEDAGVKYYSPSTILTASYNSFSDVNNLPRTSAYLNYNENSNNIYIYKRGNGGGGGYAKNYLNQSAIDGLIAHRGLHVDYTHTGPSALKWYYPTNYTINASAEEDLVYIEQKQNDGSLWVAPVYKIFDYMIALENVDITSQTTSGSQINLTIKNNNEDSIKGVTLEFSTNISSAKESGLYLIYVNNGKLVLSEFDSSESKDIEVNTASSYNLSTPRLSFVGVDIDVLNATYNETDNKITLNVENSSIGGKQINNTLTIQNYNSSSEFYAENNNIIFFSYSSGTVNYNNSIYRISYNSSTGLLNFSLPSMSTHEISIQPKVSDASSCDSGYECSGGYCVHGYCRSSSTYCGDSYCDTGETCSSCSTDCRSCDTGTPSTYKPTQEQLKEGYSKLLREGQKLQATLSNGEQYTAEISDVSKDNVIVSINGDDYLIGAEETKKIDLNNDGYYDLQISCKGVQSNGYANLEFKEIHEEVPAEEQEEQEFPTKTEGIKPWMLVILGVIGLIVTGYIILRKFKKK